MRTDRICDRGSTMVLDPRSPRFVSSYAAVIAGVGATRLITFLVSLVLARQLGVAGFGAYSLAYTFSTLVAQLPATLDATYVRYHTSTERETEQSALLRALLLSKAGVAGAVALLAAAVLPFVGTGTAGKPGISLLVFAGVVAGALFALGNTQLAFEQARERFGRYSAFSFATNALSAVALVAYLVATEPTPLGSMLAFNTWPYLVTASAVSAYLWKRSSGNGVRPALRRLFRFNVWLVPANVMYIVMQRVDLLILARLSSFAVVGQYAAAVTISSMVSLFTSNLQTIFLPRASRAFQSRSSMRRFAREGVASAAAVALLVAVCIPLTPWLIVHAVGAQYLGAATPLRILFVAYAVVAATVPLQCLMYASGRTKSILCERAAELATAIAASLVLIPKLGATGAAQAMVASAGAGLAVLVVRVISLRNDLYGGSNGD